MRGERGEDESPHPPLPHHTPTHVTLLQKAWLHPTFSATPTSPPALFLARLLPERSVAQLTAIQYIFFTTAPHPGVTRATSDIRPRHQLRPPTTSPTPPRATSNIKLTCSRLGSNVQEDSAVASAPASPPFHGFTF